MVVVKSTVGLMFAFGLCGLGARECGVVRVLEKKTLFGCLVALCLVLVH